ncbi:SGNH/GDSL hydrolase family protein [Nocardioides sp. Soil805]|uniref:SGNH/GDSL hydrolase family protein n=1 Tax=Nocardioides sp. Soil805 TaxID=1736416 RepID=UPI00138EF23C|nr:SGNH/GDSL hydrolase family protein [Nocardioides sp. Soil805]
MSKRVVPVVVVALALVAGGTWWWRDHQEDVDVCEVIRASVARRGDAPVGSGSQQVVVVGDSYAQGWGLHDQRRSWPTAMAREADATVHVDGFAGSGFTGSAFCGGEDFGTRADRLDLADGEVLVIQGGLNDVNADPDAIEAAAVAVVEQSGAAAVVGPPPAPQRDQALTVATDEALARAAEEAGVAYVSTIDWDDLSYLPDRLHLTPEGHVVFGTRVADALLDAGVLR